jgi:hypothetical protein
MFHGGNEFPFEKLKDVLGLKLFECTKDSHGNNFSMFTTVKQKRVSQILQHLEEFNRDYPAKAIQLDGGLGMELPIVTFNVHSNYRQHHIFRKIKQASEAKKAGSDVPYTVWTLDIQTQRDGDELMERYEADYSEQQAVMQDEPSSFQCQDDQNVMGLSSRATTKLRRLLDTDMVPSSFNPVGPKEQRATRTKTSSNCIQIGGNKFPLWAM